MYRFHSVQDLLPNFMTNSRNFIHNKYNEDNPNIFSLIPQRQNMQPNFMTDNLIHTTFHQSFIHTKEPNAQTQPKQPKQRHHCGFY